MNDNILEPNINGLPPITDWQKVFLVLQQANEAFLRGATLPELGKQIIGDVQIQGADFVDLPVAEDSTPVALPIPETGNKFGFLADGKFTQPTGGTLEYSATQWGLTLFDGTKWIKKFTLDLPQTDVQKVRGKYQLFNKNDYTKDVSITTTNVESSLIGAGMSKYINVPQDQDAISWNGRATSVGRIVWLSENDGGGTVVLANTTSSAAGTAPKPVGGKSFRFMFKRPGDGDTENTFMLNFGSQMTYDSYEYIKQIDGSPFLKDSANVINSVYAVLNGTSPTVNADNWFKACPVVENVTMKGNTGLGYDLKRNLFIVSEYYETTSARLLIFRNQDLVERNTADPKIAVPYRTINLTPYLDHIQGCTWDFVDDTYLALGTLKGQATGISNSVVIKVSPVGTLLDIIPLGDNLVVRVGMIDVLLDGNIVIKPDAGSTAYIFNRSYALVDRKALIGDEGICVDKYNGDIWCADGNKVVKRYNKDFIEIGTYSYNTFPNESGFSNVEGMCILPNKGLVISADAYLHGKTDLGNALYFFDFLKTVNKRQYFYLPNGVGDFKNINLGYTTEMISPGIEITDVIVDSNFTAKKSYRSGSTKAAVGNAAFTETLSTGPILQVKLNI